MSTANTSLVTAQQNLPIDMAAVTALMEEASLEVSDRWRAILVPEPAFLAMLLGLAATDPSARDVAKKYIHLINKLVPREKDGTPKKIESADKWHATRLAITSKKSTRNEKVADEYGPGVLYNSVTKQKIPEDTKFFPLFQTTSHKMFKDGLIPACVSIDGVRGEVTVELGMCKPGSVIDCGSKACPSPGYINKEGQHDKMPKPFQKGVPQAACQWMKTLYLTDSDFSDIYELDLRNQAIKLALDPLTKSLNSPGLQFDATIAHTPWFNLGTEKTVIKIPNAADSSTYYARTTKSPDALSLAEARTLLRTGIFFEHEIYKGDWIYNRDNKTAVAQTTLHDLESTVTSTEGFEGA